MRRQLWLPLIAVVIASPGRAADAWPPLPEAVSSFGAIDCDGQVYVYGGHAAKTHSYATETTLGKFRRRSMTSAEAAWEELPGGIAVQGLALVAHRGKLIRLGGMRPRNPPGEPADLVSVATCAAYDLKTGTWEPLPPLPAPRSSFDAVVIGDRIILAGGWTLNGRGEESTWFDTALMLDLSQPTPAWESIPQPFQRRALGAAARDGKLYVAGGLNPAGETQLTVAVFDIASRTWTAGPGLPGPARNGFAAALCSSQGELYASVADGAVLRLATDGNAWEPVGKLATPRIVHRLVPLTDGRLLALGGAGKGGNVRESETVTVPPRSTTRRTERP